MKAKNTAFLLADLGVTKSHSRPHTSNDNPFSEAHFKTLKYQPQFPKSFGCIEDANTFCRGFFDWYNQDHHHAGIGLMTPNQVHYGQADQVYAARQVTLYTAFRQNPERFVNSVPKPLSPFDLPNTLKTALNALCSHYEGEFERWQRAGIEVPPVFIVVCQNTAISKLVFEWIAGFERGDAEEGERAAFHAGHLELFRNYDEHGGRLPRPRTLLIDSRQIESGDALDKGFAAAAAAEIEQFKRELATREGAASAQSEMSEAALLREVMNTVGRVGPLGEKIRCVVSVSMLTEGWDTNTVTHILGVRAFGTQLLCEQVGGRGLRRQSYDLNPKTGLFDVEYADIMGIPFDFAAPPQKTKPTKVKPVTRVHAIKERGALEIIFPRVSGYRRELAGDRLEAVFTEDSKLEITPLDIGPTSVIMEGIVGAGVTITPQVLERMRPSEISFNLSKYLLYTHFRDEDGFPKQHLFPQIQRLARSWLDGGYLVTKGVPIGAILYQDQLARAAEKIEAQLSA